MTREEAKEKLKYQESKCLGFCPLINDKCRTDCVSYRCAHIYSQDRNSYEIRKETCSLLLVDE